MEVVNDFGFLPDEYRGAAVGLFTPPLTISNIENYARAMELLRDFKYYTESDDRLEVLLNHFQKNSALIIEKTWVDKGEGLYKQKLIVHIRDFIRTMNTGNYKEAADDFYEVLHEIGMLFFGEQCLRDDLAEYASRMDIPLGLFCIYARGLPSLCESAGVAEIRAMLVTGLCYLVNL